MFEYCLFALDIAVLSSAFTWLLLLFAVVFGWTVVVGCGAAVAGWVLALAAASLRAAARILAFWDSDRFIVDSVCANPEKLVVGVGAGVGAGATVVVVVVVCVSIRAIRAFIASSWVPKSAKAVFRGLKWVL